MICVGYPLGFLAWYGTADRVTAKVDHCVVGRFSVCHGSWVLGDGSRASGKIYGATWDDQGKALPARGGSYWAIAEGRSDPWIIPVSLFVVQGLLTSTVVAVTLVVVRRRRAKAADVHRVGDD